MPSDSTKEKGTLNRRGRPGSEIHPKTGRGPTLLLTQQRGREGGRRGRGLQGILQSFLHFQAAQPGQREGKEKRSDSACGEDKGSVGKARNPLSAFPENLPTSSTVDPTPGSSCLPRASELEPLALTCQPEWPHRVESKTTAVLIGGAEGTQHRAVRREGLRAQAHREDRGLAEGG